MRRKLSIQVVIGIFLTLFACSDDAQMNPYLGKGIDESILGKWNISYITKDINNSVTVFQEALTFKSNNQGDQKIYKFKSLDSYQTFQFYTKDDSLNIKYDQNKDEFRRTYTIRNDSLIIEGNMIYVK